MKRQLIKNPFNLLVDYVEDDLEPSLRQDIEMLLEHSETERQIVQGLQDTKALLRSLDEELSPPSVVDEERMKTKIMDRIAVEGYVRPSLSQRLKRKGSFLW